jgi:hypothetical protein
MRFVKKPLLVEVQFAEADGVIDTLEGAVGYRAGDALLTGVKGERWPIPRKKFSERYHPAPGVKMFCQGSYIRKPMPVDAVQMESSFNIILEGVGSITGSKNDWLLTAEDGDSWIVRDDVFRETYIPE